MRTLRNRTFTGTTSEQITERETQNRKLARRAAAEGMVLLKNEGGLLPLSTDTKVALYGVGASNTIKGGTGSGDVNERESISIYTGMKEAGFTITNEEWILAFQKEYAEARLQWKDLILEKAKTAEKEGVFGFFDTYTSTPFVMPCGGEVTPTDAEVGFYILSRVAGEGADRFAKPGDYYLTEAEEKQLSDICRIYKDVVVVINTGGLVDLSFMDRYENIRALLQIMQPGMEGGRAFADIISGAVTPSGKMTDSWAYSYEDYPSSAKFSHNDGDVEKAYYEDGIYVGYRYFDTFDVKTRYGFGYGMSYTDFIVENTAVAAENGVITVTSKVKNTGSAYTGKEVVQVYATCPAGRLPKEFRRLVSFKKTGLLAPGKEQALTQEIPAAALASYSEEAPGWLLESGPYVIWVGTSLESAVPAAVLTLDEDLLLEKTAHICPIREELQEIRPAEAVITQKLDVLMAECEANMLPVLKLPVEGMRTREVEYRTNAAIYDDEAMNFVETLTDEELIALASGDPGKGQGSNLGSAGIAVPGSAGETNNCCLDKNLASIVLSDGPAGLRLQKYYFVEGEQIHMLPFMASLEGGLFCSEEELSFPGEKYYQYCTAVPVGTLLAQSFDTELLQEVGEMIGGEMQLFDTTLWLAPGMNIHRNPLCGRNFEYYSEDPLVAGKCAAAITKGVQKVPGVGTTIKHFCCNNQEDNRMGADSVLTERTLREIYMKGFEIAVKEAQPMAIMTSYNLINGVHAANNYDILTQAARNEWGFAGMVMTDWTTTEKGPDCTAAGCMRAGNDLVMPGAILDRENLEKELQEGTMSREDLKACIARTVKIIWASNMYEDAVPYQG
ncbi:MAG: glycoside hydrolase family 3 C-terminal domain-containing protein [Eubacteriales bacterium]|nr:glycoside hydrolase family 3 C-terminal domain-containing protein [Eubacteriales bacterium]